MKVSACILCAKRKVRCDRETPCSNCKKRQTECLYSEDETNKHIERLEALVRKLGGDPKEASNENQPDNVTSHNIIELPYRQIPATSDANHTDAAIVEEENESLYLEAPIWRAWNGKYFGPIRSFDSRGISPDLVETRRQRGVFETIWCTPDLSFQERHPDSETADYLWSMYYERVHPTLKLFFDWEMDSIRERCITGATPLLTAQEQALVFAIYCLTVQSLSESGCERLESGKEELLVVYQRACEQALNAYNFWTAYDLTTLRTLVLYMCMLFSQNKYAGLWDAMGFLIRKAERIGLHRDGTSLKLSPFETERRRRLWWCIQSMDLATNSVNGATSISIMAGWDTKLPLNIEDDDISAQLQEMPKERAGLTSISHCLWRYWIVQEQRKFLGPDGRQLGMTWIVDKRLPISTRKSMIDKLEEELNLRFLRFCDPIKGLDMIMLTIARSVINFLRRATLCPGPAFKEARYFTDEDRKALLATSTQMLDYYRVAFVTPSLEPFRWHAKYLFPWSAFVHVLVELCQEDSLPEVEKLWKLIEVTYQSCPELKRMDHDRRTIYAAGLTIEAWKYLTSLYCAKGRRTEKMPSFVNTLESYLASLPIPEQSRWIRKRKREDDLSVSAQPNKRDAIDLGAAVNEIDTELFPDIPMTFEEIDWAFWSMPGGEEMMSGLGMDAFNNDKP